VRLTKEEKEMIMLRKENCGRQISVVAQLSSRSAVANNVNRSKNKKPLLAGKTALIFRPTRQEL